MIKSKISQYNAYAKANIIDEKVKRERFIKELFPHLWTINQKEILA